MILVSMVLITFAFILTFELERNKLCNWREKTEAEYYRSREGVLFIL